MGLEGSEVVKLYLEGLAEDFSCHPYDDFLYIITPYLYHDDEMIAVYLEELPEGQVKVHDGGEAVMHPFTLGFNLPRSTWGMDAAQVIAREELVELDRGRLSKTGPVAELSQMIRDVVMAARGVSDLLHAHNAWARQAYLRKKQRTNPAAFAAKLTTFLAENSLAYTPAPKLAGGSGQVYTVHYQIGPDAYLQALNPSRAARAKAAVDRTFGLWSDCNGALTRDRKLTLLNDEAFAWKAAHIHRLSQVSTVLKWSERDQLPALLAELS